MRNSVGTTDPQFRIIDVSDPCHPHKDDGIDLLATALSIYIQDTYAYIPAGSESLLIIDIQNWLTPSDIFRFNDGSYSQNVVVDGCYAYLASGGFQVLYVCPPDTAQLIKNVKVIGDIYSIALYGDCAYVGSGDQFKVFDINPPELAHEVYSCDIVGSHCVNIAVQSNYAYVAAGEKGLAIVDITSNDKPIPGPTYPVTDYATDVAVYGSYAYVTDRVGKLYMFDISATPKLTLMDIAQTEGHARSVDVCNDYIYVAAQEGGLRIFRLKSTLCTVPPVTGKSEADAEAALQAKGLKKGTITEQCSDSVQPGHVINQDPDAGTSVQCGTAVNLVISSDCPCTCMVPDLSGKCGAEIDAALEAACLKKGDIQYSYDPGVPEGCVISQDPSPGETVSCGSEVDLTISQCTCNTPMVQTLSAEDVNCTSVRLRGQVSDKGGCEYWEYCFHCWNSDATWSLDTAWTAGGTVGVPFSEKIVVPGPGTYYYRAYGRNCAGEDDAQNTETLTIAPCCSLRLVTPEPNESLVAGSVYEIQWDSNCPIPYVQIKYSQDNGKTWNLVHSQDPNDPNNMLKNDGSALWEVPNVNSNQCLLSISDPNNPTMGDKSDNVFTMCICRLRYDLNHDCLIDLRDFALLASEWLCSKPNDPNDCPK